MWIGTSQRLLLYGSLALPAAYRAGAFMIFVDIVLVLIFILISAHKSVPLVAVVLGGASTRNGDHVIPSLVHAPGQTYTNSDVCSISNEETYKDFHFAKIDVDDLPELSQELGITAMPTFVAFKNGEPNGKVIGANPAEIKNLVAKQLA
ncbi:hypothetical protein NUW58_g9116 [Xylaria curta]|uniref:Uncharacterized protein n=1 Tax=Xylaria curta TaxID=42375 RepID=A0ACC1N0J8_9PEZI|nr:hypothetical protein NUW58_g9116 [Xylaria curta]